MMLQRIILFMSMFLFFADEGTPKLTRREVLSDLSGGFCRNWGLAVAIVNDVMYVVGQDGGLFPGDHNASNHYLMTLDLSSSILDLSDGSNYKLSPIDSSVPNVKNQALWPNLENSTLYMYGGRFAANTSTDNGPWTYTIKDDSWQLQPITVKPTRLVYGAYTEATDIQAAYWVGGLQSRDTTTTIEDSTNIFAKGMIQLNTTTGEYTLLDAPFTPVQEGSLSYLPYGEMGILVFIGGEVPSDWNAVDPTMTPNSWGYVQVYDIAAAKWYNQTTAGTATSRTQFCASVQHDASSSSYQIYVIGGADYNTQDTTTDINYLSIPSFKWFSARPLQQARMSLTCATYGRQVFGIGGRLAWANGFEAGCYDMPAFIYDAGNGTAGSIFDRSLSPYVLPSSTSRDINESPYPSLWADPALKSLFATTTNSTNNRTDSTSVGDSSSTSAKKAAIGGGVAGGVVGAALIISLLWYVTSRRQQAEPEQTQSDHEWHHATKAPVINELSAGELRPELDSQTRAELQAGERFELDTGRGV